MKPAEFRVAEGVLAWPQYLGILTVLSASVAASLVLFEGSASFLLIVSAFLVVLLWLNVRRRDWMRELVVELTPESIRCRSGQEVSEVAFAEVESLRRTRWYGDLQVTGASGTTLCIPWHLAGGSVLFARLKDDLAPVVTPKSSAYATLFSMYQGAVYQEQMLERFGGAHAALRILGLFLCITIVFSIFLPIEVVKLNALLILTGSIAIIIGSYAIKRRFLKHSDATSFYVPPRDREFERRVFKVLGVLGFAAVLVFVVTALV